MTNEEAIKKIKDILEEVTETDDSVCYVTSDDTDALKAAIKALESQPCEDCISRQAVLDNAYAYGNGLEPEGYCVNVEDIQALPPVTSQSKIGHWIYTPERRLDDETDEGRIYITDYRCTCSECNSDFGFQKMSDAYCKYCGAKMEVKEE